MERPLVADVTEGLSSLRMQGSSRNCVIATLPCDQSTTTATELSSGNGISAEGAAAVIRRIDAMQERMDAHGADLLQRLRDRLRTESERMFRQASDSD